MSLTTMRGKDSGLRAAAAPCRLAHGGSGCTGPGVAPPGRARTETSMDAEISAAVLFRVTGMVDVRFGTVRPA